MVSDSVILSAISVFGTLFGVFLGYSLPKKDKLKDEIYAPMFSNLMDIQMGLNQVDLKKLKAVSWDKIHKEHKEHKLSNSLRNKLGPYFTELHNSRISLNAKIQNINNISENELIDRKLGNEELGIPDDVRDIGRFVLSVLDGGNNAIWDLLKIKKSYDSIKKEYDLTSMPRPEDYVHFIAKKIENKEHPSSMFILEHIKERYKMIIYTRQIQERIKSELTWFPKFTRFNNLIHLQISKFMNKCGYGDFGQKWHFVKVKSRKSKRSIKKRLKQNFVRLVFRKKVKHS